MSFPRFALRAAALTTALIVAACGSSGPTAAPSGQAAPTDAALPSFDLPTFDLGSFVPPSFAIPSFVSDEELEALLPDEVGGELVIKNSFSGSAVFNSGVAATESIEDLLAEVGATIDDVSVAIGFTGTGLAVIAYQIDGVSADRVFDGFLTALPSGGGMSQRTVAGRSITEVGVGAETTYIYLAGDVVFIIGGQVTPELLEDAVSQLPAA